MKIETAQDVKTLVDAGFTKEEIMAFITPASPLQSVTPEQPADSARQAPAPEADPMKMFSEKLTEAFKPLEAQISAMAQRLNMPSIKTPEPRGIDDIINDFFTK